MNRKDLEILERFDKVWYRVQNAADCREEVREQTRLEWLPDGLWEQHCALVMLAAQASGETKKRLLQEARATKQWFCRLQLQWFLETGDIYTPCKKPIFASSTLSNLRILWVNTRDMVENLQNASDWLRILTEQEHSCMIEMLERRNCILKGIIKGLFC